MRLGILGPAHDDLVGLARAAQYLLDEAQAEKVIYLSDDDALERVVFGWARDLVGEDPTEAALFTRAAERCTHALPDDIDRFVERERARLRLKVFVSLPGATHRCIEILDGRVALFVYEKGMLDAEDLAAASLLVFGASDKPVLERVGPRVYVAPGSIGAPGGGSALLDDGAGGLRIEIIDGSGDVTARDYLGGGAATSMRAEGGG